MEEEKPTDVESWSEAEPVQLDELAGVLWDTVQEWVALAIRMLPSVVIALLVLVAFFIASKFVSSFARKAIDRVSENRQVNGLLEVILKNAIIVAGLFAALAILNLDGVVTSLLAGVGVVGLALGFAFQDIAANFMSGVLMALQRPFRVGDLIETSTHFGTVERVDLRVTHLRTPKGEVVLIPNKDVYNNSLVNFTHTPERRIDIDVGVGYDDDLELARETVVRALNALDARIEDKPAEVVFTGFGGSSIDFTARFWIRTQGQWDFLSARSEGIIAIKKALDEAGLNIPFPIRTLDFGAAPVGGVRLDTVLKPMVSGMKDEGAMSADADALAN